VVIRSMGSLLRAPGGWEGAPPRGGLGASGVTRTVRAPPVCPLPRRQRPRMHQRNHRSERDHRGPRQSGPCPGPVWLRLSRVTVYGRLGLHGKEAPRMAHVRCIAVQARPTEFLDVTSVTLVEFPRLVPPFEAALHAQMASWYLDGKPRTARRFTVDKHCPLPSGRAKPPSRLSRQHLAM